ncbi:MAG: hypothetical protein JWO25_3080 [Alphaproteobacteria bacterium]|nr:hypothetical protein [Alphaproteobacteria bacterium]
MKRAAFLIPLLLLASVGASATAAVVTTRFGVSASVFETCVVGARPDAPESPRVDCGAAPAQTVTVSRAHASEGILADENDRRGGDPGSLAPPRVGDTQPGSHDELVITTISY